MVMLSWVGLCCEYCTALVGTAFVVRVSGLRFSQFDRSHFLSAHITLDVLLFFESFTRLFCAGGGPILARHSLLPFGVLAVLIFCLAAWLMSIAVCFGFGTARERMPFC